ncbi:hypothetical protein CVT26_008339 [Gymnopilus dilepis]|uniref:Uncharacterized protein n=1 Tax=Gymnopilus dilepis TaxID=231916 RepID=A0A409XY43_9AGAR|nr:hypothetical protein CVT26_008339 [Gymnopilus dilepis]
MSLDSNTGIGKERNHASDPITLRLPPELVARVFLFYIADCRPLLDPNAHGAVLATPKFHCSAPLYLSAVCKGWRAIAFATPSLWTTVQIYLYSVDKISSQSELLGQWLGRSGRLPLRIAIAQGFVCNSIPSSQASIYNIIKVFARRWQKLHLLLPTNHVSLVLAETSRLARLESLQIWLPRGLDRVPSNVEHSAALLPRMPRLISFGTGINSTLKTPALFKNLQVCHLYSIGLDDILKVLTHATNLETLLLSEPGLMPTTQGAQSGIFTHCCIKNLQIRPDLYSNAIVLPVFFQHLALPSLQCFGYDATLLRGSDVFPIHDFLAFLQRSGCSVLHEVEIIGTCDSMEDRQLIRILENLPTVTQLSLKCCEQGMSRWLNDEFFRRFGRQYDGTPPAIPPFLPNLEVLNIETSAVLMFSWTAIIDFLDSIHASMSIRGLSEEAGSPELHIWSGQRNHIDISFILGYAHRVRHDRAHPYISPGIVPHLTKPTWRSSINLLIKDEKGGVDLIAESLAYSSLHQASYEDVKRRFMLPLQVATESVLSDGDNTAKVIRVFANEEDCVR